MNAGVFRFKTESLRKIQLRFAWGSKEFAGKVGEALAREVFNALGIVYENVDQSKETINSDLLSHGGKRPDFVLKSTAENHIVLGDAKYHKTNAEMTFALAVSEIGKYKGLKTYIEDEFPDHKVDVVFFLFPQESLGGTFALILLDEFNEGTGCSLGGENAISLSLEGKLRDPKSGDVIR